VLFILGLAIAVLFAVLLLRNSRRPYTNLLPKITPRGQNVLFCGRDGPQESGDSEDKGNPMNKRRRKITYARLRSRIQRQSSWKELKWTAGIIGGAVALSYFRDDSAAMHVITIIGLAFLLRLVVYIGREMESHSLANRTMPVSPATPVPTRYGEYIDDYVEEELRREYVRRVPAERIELLKEILANRYDLPESLAKLVVTDADASVRAWAARTINLSVLDDEDTDSSVSMPTWYREYRQHVRWRGRVLQDDPDVFVRASLFENPHTFGYLTVNFESGLERFGFCHNPRLPDDLFGESIVEQVLNLDHAMNISEQSRLPLH
jgi:hypothetical protein